MQKSSATTVTSLNSGGAKTQPQSTSRPQSTASIVRVTADDMNMPESAARAVNDVQVRLSAATLGSRTNPRNNAARYIQNVAFVSGQTKLLYHNLGRAPIGYGVVDTYPPAAAAVLVRRTTLPAGITSAQAIALIPSASGTCTVEIF